MDINQAKISIKHDLHATKIFLVEIIRRESTKPLRNTLISSYYWYLRLNFKRNYNSFIIDVHQIKKDNAL